MFDDKDTGTSKVTNLFGKLNVGITEDDQHIPLNRGNKNASSLLSLKRYFVTALLTKKKEKQ